MDQAARYCAGCGSRLGERADGGVESGSTHPRGIQAVTAVPRLSVLDASGDVSRIIPLDVPRATLSSDGLGLQIGDHWIGGDGATLSVEQSSLRIEPLGAPRALFVFLTEETTLSEGDVLLIGSQVIRCRAVVDDGATYFADHGSVQAGSVIPSNDVAVLEQLRGDGRVRDSLHLWANRSILIGREEGDWLFPYDRTMSAKHAVILCDAAGTVSARDVGSRNGVALAVRAPRQLTNGQRVSLGGQVMRVDLA